MSGTVFAVVLLAAALHAGWNALVKGGADKAAAMAAVVIGQGAAAILLLPFAPIPDPACWPYLLGGVLLHLGYQLFLMKSYSIGDLTQVYPIARGVAPLIVAGVSVLLLGVRFSQVELLAMGLISVGIASISLTRRADGLFQVKAAGLALITGMFIASYSLVDGQGARIAGTALGFFALLSILNTVGFVLVAAVARPGLVRRGLAMRRMALFGGGASFLAYLLVVWGFTQAPIALVTALREVSIVFALILGVTILREPVNLAKVASTALTLSGALLLRLGRS